MDGSTQTLITANVPEWITSFMGFVAMVTGLGVITFIWLKLKPLVNEQIETYIDPLKEKIKIHAEQIETNRRAVDLLRDLESKQDTAIEVLKKDVEHLDERLGRIEDKINKIYDILTQR